MTPEELEKLLKEKGLHNQWKRNSDYWQKRFMLLEDVMNNKGAEYMKSTEKIYEKATSDINIEIRSWYQRFATNEGISFAEAQKMLTGKELKEFHMTVEEYIEKGKTLGVSSKWAKELERASVRVHVTRLEQLKTQMQQHVEELTAKKSSGINNLMKNIYNESYYRSIFEMQKGVGIGSTFAKLDTKAVEKALSKPWAADGSNFSQRIWGSHRAQLVNKLHEGLTLNLIQGESADKLIDNISKTFEVDRKRVATLVFTEKAYFQSLAQLESFKNMGVEEYEVVAILDSKTSDICQEMNMKSFKTDEYMPGVTAHPFHPRCRSTTRPKIDDEFMEGEERLLKDEEGNYYTVPADMKYDDWYKAFVEEQHDILDYMGKAQTFANEKFKIKAYKVDSVDTLYTQTYSKDAQNTIKFISEMKSSDIIDGLSKIVIADDLPGIAAYEHINDILYVNEKISSQSYIDDELLEGYFVAENAIDVIKHEMFHKKHWDFMMTNGKDSATIKKEIEAKLRKYIVEQQRQDYFYLLKVVSENASFKFLKDNSLNEVIAEVLLQEEKGIVCDEVLLKLVRGCVE